MSVYEELVGATCRGICAALKTGQCAPVCLSHFSTSTTKGQCPEAPRVWKTHATAAVAVIRETLETVTQKQSDVMHGEEYSSAPYAQYIAGLRASALYPEGSK